MMENPIEPYLIRAYHDWMTDANLTPHILVNCLNSGVILPKSQQQQTEIVLNISHSAANNLLINTQEISFDARFDGKSQTIHIPMGAVISIYTREDGRGMMFQQHYEDANPPKTDDKPKLTLV